MSEKYVLIVEDDPFYSKIYKTKLAKENLNALLASNGNDAIKTIKEQGAPALVLLDLIMPGKDGFETLAEIKQDPTMKDVPVVVLSNLSQEEDINRVKALGASEYLIKSNISIQEVVDKIKNSLA